MPDIGLAEARRLLAGARAVLILTHERPDGDAAASVGAAATMLRLNNAACACVMPEPAPPRHMRYAAADARTAPEPGWPDGFDLCLCLDASTRDRLAVGSGWAAHPLDALPSLVVDHHPDNTRFGTMNLVLPDRAATAEILFDLFAADWPAPIPPEAAARLLAGILFDTGGLRFSNTSASALAACSRLVAMGADYQEAVRSLFLSKPANVLRLEAEAVLRRTRLAFGGRFAYCLLTPALLERHGVEPKDADGVVDAIRRAEGVKASAVVYRLPDGIKASLRSEDPRYPVGPAARARGGGGHEMAAGFKLDTTDFRAAARILLKAVAPLFQDAAG